MTKIPATLLALALALTTTTALSAAAPESTPPPPSRPLPLTPEPLPGLQGRPDAVGEELLAGTYQNPLAGIAFRTPVNCLQVKAAGGDQIARFVNEKAGWEIICTRNSSDRPMPLVGGGGEGMPKLGLLDAVAARLKQANPGVDLVRQEVEKLGDQQVGMIVARVSAVGQRKLFQQSIIQANDQLYYSLTMTSPAAKDAKGADSEDPAEKRAADAFRQMLDTVKLLDRGAVKEDQNERLFRTRAFLTTLTAPKLRQTLIPEQWLRLLQNGKDIGYMYVVEEMDSKGGTDRIKIGVRSRTYPDDTNQVDGETWFIVNTDRRHEDWSNLMWVQNRATKKGNQIVEIGSSDRRTNRQADMSGQIAVGDAKDPKQPPVRTFDIYELNVQTPAEPVKRSLPPFYLPQALGHLLPRLLPTREPKTYLFATYASDRKEVMMRYVDVGSEQEVDIAGKRVRAVPVTDRLGIEGSPTIHYIDPSNGKYLASINNDSKITILPTNAETLQKRWQNADLSRPKPAAEPATPAAPAASKQSEAVGGEAVKQ
jgi:hypothetical protein